MSEENAKVAELVKKIIADELGIDANKVVPEASFIEDLGADSLDTVHLIMALESQFDTEIPDEEAQKILTVKDAIEYINTRCLTAAAS